MALRLSIVGLGAQSCVPSEELERAVELALAAAGLQFSQVAVLATLDRRAAEPALRALAARRSWTLRGYSREDLADVDVPSPSATVLTRVGTPGVAEAAALLAAGPGAVLVARKRVFPRVTVAIARRVPA
jgi:cobalt-precorrin 5A hydrolase